MNNNNVMHFLFRNLQISPPAEDFKSTRSTEPEALRETRKWYLLHGFAVWNTGQSNRIDVFFFYRYYFHTSKAEWYENRLEPTQCCRTGIQNIIRGTFRWEPHVVHPRTKCFRLTASSRGASVTATAVAKRWLADSSSSSSSGAAARASLNLDAFNIYIYTSFGAHRTGRLYYGNGRRGSAFTRFTLPVFCCLGGRVV